MAYAALVSLAQTIEQIDSQNHNQYCSISLHHKQQCLSLNKNIFVLREFLEDFPNKAKANSLESRIRDVANEAEDMIEIFMWEQTQCCFRSGEWRFLFASFSGFKFIWQMGKIRRGIESITGEVIAMKNNSTTINDNVVQLGDSASSSRHAPASRSGDMVGLYDDLLAIKDRLCGEPAQLQIIPIVGMGGIGKTTLAKTAYDDPLTMDHFDFRAWVTVSQDYSIQKMLSTILLYLKKFLKNFRWDDESDEVKVFKCLKSRRYLIVMDDMWSADVWDCVRHAFPDDNNGSRIILTTRLFDVASYAASLSHVMHLMDDNQSWNLLREKVFRHQEYCPPALEGIGKEIAKGCRGLPLAIVVIAGILSTDKNPTRWREIAENVNSVVATQDEQFQYILSLSYTNLPHHLRPCFLFMGGFEEDQEIRGSKLLKLWVAEGFLRSSRDGSKSFEEEAEECLEELVNRSLVLVTKRKTSGKIKSCSLHDLMRDLCIRKGHENKFLLKQMNENADLEGVVKHRRLSLHSSGLTYLSSISHCSTIRTILCFHHISLLLDFVKCCRLLRVLDLEHAQVRSLPAQLFELFFLTYLAINYPQIVPADISKLRNLQTLVICSFKGFLGVHMECLPQQIWRMPQLRHLIFCGRLPDPEIAASTLENLQTLSKLSYLSCTERILKMIPSIKKLEIDCSFYRDGEHLNNLVCLHQLEILELRSFPRKSLWEKHNFALPSMLKKLALSELRLPWDEMTIVGQLPNLEVLKLRDFACQGGTWETNEGEFPQLKFLRIGKLDLEHWFTESSHFPRLESLVLKDCFCLSEIPEGIGEIPTLALLKVKGRVKRSLDESAKRILEEQLVMGNDTINFIGNPPNIYALYLD